jgi:hypothetical protein
LSKKMIAGRLSCEVVGLLTDVLEEDLSPQVRGELRYQLGIMLHEVGDDPDRVRRLLTSAVEELDARPKLQARAMVVLGFPTANGVPLAEHRSWLQRALRTLERIDDPDFEYKVAVMRRWHAYYTSGPGR